jgi:hypothetical protein
MQTRVVLLHRRLRIPQSRIPLVVLDQRQALNERYNHHLTRDRQPQLRERLYQLLNLQLLVVKEQVYNLQKKKRSHFMVARRQSRFTLAKSVMHPMIILPRIQVIRPSSLPFLHHPRKTIVSNLPRATQVIPMVRNDKFP